MWSWKESDPRLLWLLDRLASHFLNDLTKLPDGLAFVVALRTHAVGATGQVERVVPLVIEPDWGGQAVPLALMALAAICRPTLYSLPLP